MPLWPPECVPNLDLRLPRQFLRAQTWLLHALYAVLPLGFWRVQREGGSRVAPPRRHTRSARTSFDKRRTVTARICYLYGHAQALLLSDRCPSGAEQSLS